MGREGILAVIQMQRLQLVQAQDPVKFTENAIQIRNNVITAVVHMTGVQTDAHIAAAHRIHDGLQFFKSAANFTALAGHGFQQHRHGIVVAQCPLQCFSNVADPGIHALTHMAAGMEIIEIPGQSRHPAQIILQHLCRKGPGFRVRSTQIHSIGTVGHQRTEPVLFQQLHCLCRISSIFRLCLASPGIAGKERKGIGPNGQGRFHHCRVSLGRGQVTAKITQIHHSFLGIIAYFTPKCKFPLFRNPRYMLY